ncbi:MAG: hypothetical protein CL915_04870 [Deltaproteobacteria bacterium]|nr:hypothetical protein [Deltaproteobacteria bacterium]
MLDDPILDLAVNVAVHQLKANLFRLLARAQAGEVIEVTSHRKPITRMGSPRTNWSLPRLSEMFWGAELEWQKTL